MEGDGPFLTSLLSSSMVFAKLFFAIGSRVSPVLCSESQIVP